MGCPQNALSHSHIVKSFCGEREPTMQRRLFRKSASSSKGVPAIVLAWGAFDPNTESEFLLIALSFSACLLVEKIRRSLNFNGLAAGISNYGGS